MSFPSLLWSAQAHAPAVPENIVRDLYLDCELRAGTLALIRQPCSAEEIVQRQSIFALLLRDGELRGSLSQLRDNIENISRLVRRIDQAESDAQKAMLFLPAMRDFFETANKWTKFSELDGRLGEVGRYFSDLLGQDDVAECAKKCADLLSKRDPKLKLRIRGGQLYASEGREMLRDRLENAMRGMGLEDSVPQVRNTAFAAESMVKAYSGVYSGWCVMAENFFASYSDKYLQNEYDIHAMSVYSEEISFLLDCAQYFVKLEDNGYTLTYPAVSRERVIELDGLRDPSLLRRDVSGEDVVPNDVRMAAEKDGERLNFFILSGANGGGKTTFLRSVGLAVLFFITGCPVVAERGRMYPFDSLYAHFPSNESFENSGRFVNENERAMEILDSATENSFTLLNETYSCTDEKKCEEYSLRLANTLWERGVFGIYVTHIHALTGGKIPTLEAVIDENDDNRRTYRIKRVGGTKSSYARDILKKYGLDALSLEKRLEENGKERKNV